MAISKSPMQIHRNWLDLPRDVTVTIMEKIEASELLESVQYVCRSWYILCKEQPSLWHTFRTNESYMMLRSAVHRSAGCLIDLDIEGKCTPELLSYALSRSSQLKRLRLALCEGISVTEVKEALEKLSSLEELELTLCDFQRHKVVPIILSCPSLTTFKLNTWLSTYYWDEDDNDDEALAIAATMPELRHLQLIGNCITNDGLSAILNGCPLLQSLDLRTCFMVDLTESLERRLLDMSIDLLRPRDYCNDYSYFNYGWY